MKTGVIIGRFQPVHRFHINNMIIPALKEMDQVIILLGSQLKPRNIKNPFTFEATRNMIIDSLIDMYPDADVGRLAFEPIRDFPYSDSDWKYNVRKIIGKYASGNIYLFGTKKDDSTFYLDLFPEWSSEYIKDINKMDNSFLENCATTIRKAWLEENIESLNNNPLLLPAVKQYLIKNNNNKDIIELRKEYNFIKKYKQQFESLPYPPIFSTVDNIVEWKNNILLIKRRSLPGKGLWALPGGFVEQKETLLQSAYRELEEETNITIFVKNSSRKLKFSLDWLQSKDVFDAPERSLRGRTITHAFHWKIPDHFDVNISAGSDASSAKWYPIFDVLESMHFDMYEDHQDIVSIMLLNKKIK
jgi:bifunctional NMN adenylyltransferase/nudix hydrolase